MIPATQAMQVDEEDAPVAADALPAAHEVQLACPAAAANEPALQPEHAVAPAPEEEPAAQLLQLNAPAAAP